MAKVLIKELREENNRLFSDLLFSQKCIDFMKIQRKLLIEFNINCICDQNFGQKIRFNELEVQYKTIESELQRIESTITEISQRSDVSMSELALNLTQKSNSNQYKSLRKKSSTNYTEMMSEEEEEDNRLDDTSAESDDDFDSDEEFDNNSMERPNIPKQRSFICGYNKCPNTYPTRHEVLAHIKSCHTMNERPVKATKPRQPKNKSQTQGEVKHRCEYSGCTFETKYPHNLNEHYLRHRNIRRFKCTEIGCEKSFMTNNKLKRHTNTVHSTERPYGCDWPGCEATYKCQQLLNNHRLTHLNERKYKCDFMGCEKSFVTGKALFGHKLQHRKPYLCNWPACGQRFGSNRSLKTHMNRHQNIKPYKCEFNGCDKCFYSKPELNQHLKHSHNYSFFPNQMQIQMNNQM